MTFALVIAFAAGLFIRRIRKQSRAKIVAARADDLPEFIDQLIVLLRAGYTPANALAQIEPWLPSPMNAFVAEVNALVGCGVRFASAVVELRSRLGPPAFPIVDALIQLDLDGTSATTILDRLSGEAHSQRRLRTEAKARELPIRLIFPMVCCVFPSFIILTIVPMLAGTLTGLRTHLGQ